MLIEQVVFKIYEEGMITVQQLESVKQKTMSSRGWLSTCLDQDCQIDDKNLDRFFKKMDFFFNEFQKKLIPLRANYYADINQQFQKLKSNQSQPQLILKCTQFMNKLQTKIVETVFYVQQNQYTLHKSFLDQMSTESSLKSINQAIKKNNYLENRSLLANNIMTIQDLNSISTNVQNKCIAIVSTISVFDQSCSQQSKPKIHQDRRKIIKQTNKKQLVWQRLHRRINKQQPTQQKQLEAIRSLKKVGMAQHKYHRKIITNNLVASKSNGMINCTKNTKDMKQIKSILKVKQFCYSHEKMRPMHTSLQRVLKSYIICRPKRRA